MLHYRSKVGFSLGIYKKKFHLTQKTLENLTQKPQKKFQKQKFNNKKLGTLGIKYRQIQDHRYPANN
jgi:hypothetical protein